MSTIPKPIVTIRSDFWNVTNIEELRAAGYLPVPVSRSGGLEVHSVRPAPPTSLLCQIVGHRWKDRVKRQWEGAQEPYCLRCGYPNPNAPDQKFRLSFPPTEPTPTSVAKADPV